MPKRELKTVDATAYLEIEPTFRAHGAVTGAKIKGVSQRHPKRPGMFVRIRLVLPMSRLQCLFATLKVPEGALEVSCEVVESGVE